MRVKAKEDKIGGDEKSTSFFYRKAKVQGINATIPHICMDETQPECVTPYNANKKAIHNKFIDYWKHIFRDKTDEPDQNKREDICDKIRK